MKKSHYRWLVVICLTLGGIPTAAAQTITDAMDELLNVKYTYGEAVLTNGDTLRGAFEFNNCKDNYKNLVYRISSSPQKQLFTPDEVQYFYLNENWYFPKEYDGEKYFMMLCYNDSLSMYLHRHYYTTNEANRCTFYYLLEKSNGDKLFVKNNPDFHFKSKVGNFLQDCPEVAFKIKKGKLGFKNLTDIVREYNDWLHAKNRK